MVKVHILAEGQTEYTFVRDVLSPHFEDMNIFLNSKILTTKITKNGYQFKGGVSKYEKIKKDILRLLGDKSVDIVSTLIDYYGFPADIPGGIPEGKDCYEKVSKLEDNFSKNINNERFLPFLELHEFEALLFSDSDKIINTFPRLQQISVKAIKDIEQRYSNPEEINDGVTTHPSARLQHIIPEYNKKLYGSIISKKIGLSTIRNRCRHFDEWLKHLENISVK